MSGWVCLYWLMHPEGKAPSLTGRDGVGLFILVNAPGGQSPLPHREGWGGSLYITVNILVIAVRIALIITLHLLLIVTIIK